MIIRFPRFSTWAFALAAACFIARPSLAQPATQPAKLPGRDRVTFTERGELGLWPEMARRFQWHGKKLDEPYKIVDQTFEVYVPAEVPGQKYSLLVWINSEDNGDPPPAWHRVLDKHHMIWIGANRGGNEHAPAERFALAIDAAENAKKKYSVDETRVYVAGVSGGGRCSSMVAPMYPDLFRGGFYLVGCDYFRPVPVAGSADMVWRSPFKPPLDDLLALAKKRSRFVLLTGEKDMNREQTLATYESGYVPDGFAHVTYLEVPAMGHDRPTAEWFEKGLDALDPLP